MSRKTIRARYTKGMAKVKSIDPFVCNEPAVEISPATSRILKQRMRTADEGRVVSAEMARQRMQQWFLKSSSKPILISPIQ